MKIHLHHIKKYGPYILAYLFGVLFCMSIWWISGPIVFERSVAMVVRLCLILFTSVLPPLLLWGLLEEDDD